MPASLKVTYPTVQSLDIHSMILCGRAEFFHVIRNVIHTLRQSTVDERSDHNLNQQCPNKLPNARGHAVAISGSIFSMKRASHLIR